MKHYKSDDMKKAAAVAGYRERYAMEHGSKTIIYINNHKCYKFTYSKYLQYQDANGTIYDTVSGMWIN